jgi:hypothetical protein
MHGAAARVLAFSPFSSGQEMKLKIGSHVDVTIEVDPTETIPMKPTNLSTGSNRHRPRKTEQDRKPPHQY